MPHAYKQGQQYALFNLGLTKTASPPPLHLRHRKDPFQEIHRRIARAFRLKMPKFDIAALMKRLLRNPFRQPTLQIGGKMPYLKF